MTNLLILALGVWVTWEWVIDTLPFRIPPVLQPILVAGLAYGLAAIHLPQVRTALAAAGAVALLHTLIARSAVTPVRLNRRPRLPG